MTSPLLADLHPDDRALLEAVPEADLVALGAPPSALAADRRRALELVEAGLPGCPPRVSPLGAAWSRDIDVTGPCPTDPATLGWVCLDPLFERLGSPGRGRWLVLDGDRPVGLADIGEAARDDVTQQVLSRAVRQGRVDLRVLLELRVLARGGSRLPDHEVTRAAARLERGLGGDQLQAWFAGPPTTAPVPLRSGVVRRRLSGVRRWLRPRPVVALSGVDGAGKSGLASALVEDLRRAGLDAEIVWTRPGMRMDWFDHLRRWFGRRRSAPPTVATVARGERVDTPSRRGVTGWIWTMLVTVTFLGDVWRQHLRRSGLKVYDRHTPDALVTLDFVYEGVRLGLPRALVRHGLPAAFAHYYLDIDAPTAAARKPDDTFGLHAVSRQLDGYAETLAGATDVRRLDATARPDELVAAVVRDLGA